VALPKILLAAHSCCAGAASWAEPST
jgi:hypothetical protein